MLVVRPARPDEFAAVGALTVAAYDEAGHLVMPDGSYDHSYAGWLADAAMRGGDERLLVAVGDDDQPLGTVLWCPPGSPHRDLVSETHQGELRTLAVSPQARHRGIARLLVDECLRRAHDLGLTQIWLCSLPEMKPAHQLYASYGFVRRPERDWSPVADVQLWAFCVDLDPT